MTKQNIKRAGLRLVKGAAFTIGLLAEVLYIGGRAVYSQATKLYLWSETRLAPAKLPPTTKIPVKQLGLATGQHVNVNVRRPGPVRKINVRYIKSE